jgi:hypothetical protein
MAEINRRKILAVVLHQVLAEHPDGIVIHDAYDAIDSNYEFPEEWYELLPMGSAYDELKALGYPDWKVLSEEKLVQLVKTEPRWQNEMRWARLSLQDQGLIDKTSGRGVWRLNRAGLKASEEDTTKSLSSTERRAFKRRPAGEVVQKPATPLRTPGTKPSLRQSLEARLNNLISGMPLADLETLVEIARVIRSRSVAD